MRPCAIQGIAGLSEDTSPSERFEQFAQMIVSVPKAEADREMEKSGVKKYTTTKPRRLSKKRH